MIAYNKTDLYNLIAVTEMMQWLKHGKISEQQFGVIRSTYVSSLYRPNFIIGLLLFIATILAVACFSGLVAMGVHDDKGLSVLSIIYGVALLAALELLFIKSNKHYKSGVNEALLYLAVLFIVLGWSSLSDWNLYATLIVTLVICAFAAVRYLDLIATIVFLVCLAWLMFSLLFAAGGLTQQIIPFVFIFVFAGIYFFIQRIEKNNDLFFWQNILLVSKAFCLVIIYVSGNYLVIQKLSEELMSVEGQIPFAWIFYVSTALIPFMYLYFGIRNKNVLLLRISLLMIAFSAFTFKYYFSLGHPEITLTLAGAVVLGITILVLNYLKTPKHGYTRENIFSEKWSSLNAEGFIISQTMGGNKIETQEQAYGGGGSFGGGGASDSF